MMEAETPAGPSCKLVIGVAIDRSIGRTPERSGAERSGAGPQVGRDDLGEKKSKSTALVAAITFSLS